MTCDRCGSEDLAFCGVDLSDRLASFLSDSWLFTCNNCGVVVALSNEQLEATRELA